MAIEKLKINYKAQSKT